MALTNNLQRQVDLPVWEWMRFAPVASAAASFLVGQDAAGGRYLYYSPAGATLFRYDTWSDGWQQLASPLVAGVTNMAATYRAFSGYGGRVISATSSTLTIAGLSGGILSGAQIRIVGGTGAGQERTITAVADVVAADSGVPTAVSNTSPYSITDSTKAWAVNQWVGYQVAFRYGTGPQQIRRILYNSATQLVFEDDNYSAIDPLFGPILTTATVAAPSVSASLYTIESSVVTVNTNWAVTPDATSRFLVQTGGLWVLTAQAGTPFYNMQFYDCAADVWYRKTGLTSHFLVQLATDFSIASTGEAPTQHARGTATGGSATTLVDTGQAWEVDQFAGMNVRIWAGTGEGDLRAISSNTATTLTIASGTAIDNTSCYVIEGFLSGTATAGAAASLTDSTLSLTTNQYRNFAIRITGGLGAGQQRTILSHTGTVFTVRPWDTVPDNTSTYVIIGDSDNIWMIGHGSPMLKLYSQETDQLTSGQQLDFGVARHMAGQYADHTPFGIATITLVNGPPGFGTATVTTVLAHNLKTGMSVRHTGCTGADAAIVNITATITVLTTTTYTYQYVGTASFAGAVFVSQATVFLVDTTKAWTVNEHVGKIVQFNTPYPTGTTQARKIVSNTATMLTWTLAATAPVNGTSRYTIVDPAGLGAQDTGTATATGATTTLTDSGKAWTTNQWSGKWVQFLTGSGTGQIAQISSNTATVLTFGAVTTAPDVSTMYAILRAPNLSLGASLQWVHSPSVAEMKGRYLVTPRGGGSNPFLRYDIAANSWDLLAVSPWSEGFTTGTTVAYDGGDYIYLQKDSTHRVYRLNVVTGVVEPAGVVPYVASTVVLGNRMEIVRTTDGLKFLYFLRHTGTELWRTLLFW